jgi:hypothetical protein
MLIHVSPMANDDGQLTNLGRWQVIYEPTCDDGHGWRRHETAGE